MITRKTTDISSLDFNRGEIFLIDKSLYKTSFSVINRLRKEIGVKKAGHAGTLDPRATGLLIVCTGKKTKEIESFQSLPKTYTGIITLGKTTPSMDSETDVIEERSIEGINEENILRQRDLFLGEIQQIPPMYSAVKFKGKALYKYARKGVLLEIKPKKVYISKFEITKLILPDIYFEITCSKGTYIRVIAHDFGQALGCGAYLSELRRTRIGDYSVEDAFTITDFIDFTRQNQKLNTLNEPEECHIPK